MPVHHDIDHAQKLIITTWNGDATDDEFIHALSHYQTEIKGNSDYQSYNELLDFRQIDKLNLSTKGIINLTKIARKTDRPDIESKLAIVVSSSLAFGLARMYITYRSLEPGSHKSLKVFKSKADALDWLTHLPVRVPDLEEK